MFHPIVWGADPITGGRMGTLCVARESEGTPPNPLSHGRVNGEIYSPQVGHDSNSIA